MHNRSALGLFVVGAFLAWSYPARASSNDTAQSSWVAGLKQMTAQVGALSIQNAGIMGLFYDAQSANTAILVQQKLAASAYASYMPGENLCRIGTMTRSLASADQARELTLASVHQILLNRETHNVAHGQSSDDYDQLGKLGQYGTTHCNPGDNDGMTIACPDAGAAKGAARFNRDLDFTRLFLTTRTLDLNFADSTLTSDEQDVLSWAANLSAFQTLPTLSAGMSSLTTSPVVINHFQDMRSLTAARGTVRATVSNMIAKKSPGGAGSSLFMANILREMGMSDAEAARSVTGAATGASYDAQMEVLAKKIYENPNFYTNLVDKPDGVDRTRASMTAIKLMQGRDMVEASYRRELLLAQLLESRLKDEEIVEVNARLTRAKSK